MIRKVYETDPLLCPRCGGQMPACACLHAVTHRQALHADRSIIAFIEDHKVIDKIIAHLKLTFHAERPPPPRVLQQELLIEAEEKREYF